MPCQALPAVRWAVSPDKQLKDDGSHRGPPCGLWRDRLAGCLVARGTGRMHFADINTWTGGFTAAGVAVWFGPIGGIAALPAVWARLAMARVQCTQGRPPARNIAVCPLVSSRWPTRFQVRTHCGRPLYMFRLPHLRRGRSVLLPLLWATVAVNEVIRHGDSS